MVAEPALGRPASHVVLDPVAGEHAHTAVVQPDREANRELSVRRPERLAHSRIEVKVVGSGVELGERGGQGARARGAGGRVRGGRGGAAARAGAAAAMRHSLVRGAPPATGTGVIGLFIQGAPVASAGPAHAGTIRRPPRLPHHHEYGDGRA